MNKKTGSDLLDSSYAYDIDDILSHLDSSNAGLSKSEAEDRLKEYGYNRLRQTAQRSVLLRFFSQFHNPLIYILIVAAGATFFMGKYIDTMVISAVVIVNALIGFYHEGKAERALEEVKKMLSPEARVIRDNQRFSIEAEKLVPGDIVALESGDKVAADMRLIKVKNLQVDEAILTGESMPVAKKTEALEKNKVLGDQANMAFSGTLVTSGQALGVVTGTGDKTALGQISQMLSTVKTLQTPLLRKVTFFGRWLSVIIILLSAALFFYGYFFYGYSLSDMFIAAVSIAVASIPEGLPIILTVTLSIGVQRMAKRNTIIRRLPAVETLGSVSVICTDKTGTLTRNELTVQSVCLAHQELAVSGVGYFSSGQFSEDDNAVSPKDNADLLELCQAIALCNDAEFHQSDDDEEKKLVGDPTEGALLALAVKAGQDYADLRKKYPRHDSIPFESEHRFMATLNDDNGKGLIYIKGAPEAIIPRCGLQRCEGSTKSIAIDFWQDFIKQRAAKGERMLAVAYKEADSGQQQLHLEHVKDDLVLLGIVGMMDPPRDEVIKAVKECKNAGIRPIMITGDHALTAAAIAKKIGISDNDKALTGSEIEDISDETVKERIGEVNVFARAAPEHKLRLVKILQRMDKVVAMTGDGVNDAPALKRADIGVAMGIKGSEVAKEAAEMVLTDDNFASIVAAVKEGRTVYDNLKKAISFLLPINGGESLSIIVAILFGFILPITPVQILWVNMVSSVTLGMALAFEPHEPGIMHRPPVDKYESLINRRLVWRIGFVSLIFLAGIFGIFQWTKGQGFSVDLARTQAVNTLVVLEVFYLFSSRYIHGSSLSARGIRGTPAVLIAVAIVTILQLGFTYAPFMNYLFDSRALSLQQVILVLIIGIGGFLIFEAEKLLTLYWRGELTLQHA